MLIPLSEKCIINTDQIISMEVNTNIVNIRFVDKIGKTLIFKNDALAKSFMNSFIRRINLLSSDMTYMCDVNVNITDN